MKIQQAREMASAFGIRIDQIKSEHSPSDWSWYGYDTMANLHMLEQLLSDICPELFSSVSGPILDIGAADGDFAFFLESLGFDVDIVDLPSTNWNGLRGAYELKRRLDSAVDIHEIDLDSAFQLPDQQYDLVIFLGILYHLKNPFYVLERLSASSKRMVLSTRIARQTADEERLLEDIPVAYLVDELECNNDPTNFWIFSRLGLERILKRSGWKTVNFITVGDTAESNPRENEHDERAFVFAESTRFD